MTAIEDLETRIELLAEHLEARIDQLEQRLDDQQTWMRRLEQQQSGRIMGHISDLRRRCSALELDR